VFEVLSRALALEPAGHRRRDVVVDVLLLLVLSQAGRSQLAAITRLPHAAPLCLRQVWVEVIDPDRAVAQARGDSLCLTGVAGPHGASEAVLRVIRDLDRVLLGAEGFLRDDRTEGLVVHSVHPPRGAVDDRRQVEVARGQVAVTGAVRRITLRPR